jgi:hypothetical protein
MESIAVGLRIYYIKEVNGPELEVTKIILTKSKAFGRFLSQTWIFSDLRFPSKV